MNILKWLDERAAACDKRAGEVEEELRFVYLDGARENREARAAVAELIAERNRLANTVRSHEKQIIRMTGERAELVAKANAYLSAEDDYQADYYSANSAQLYADKQNARAELDAALARVQGGGK